MLMFGLGLGTAALAAKPFLVAPGPPSGATPGPAFDLSGAGAPGASVAPAAAPGAAPAAAAPLPDPDPPVPVHGLGSATVIDPPAREPPGDSIAINFEGVEILSLLRYLSQETGKGFIIDEAVRGSITIISPVRLTREEALATLESILQVKGFTAIPSGRMYKIVPLAQAKVAGTETRMGAAPSGISADDTLVTQIIPLEKTSVDEAKNILAPLLPPDSSMLVFPPSNTLIVTGRSVNIRRALEVLVELEKGRLKPGLDIVPLQYAAAPELKTQLEQIIQAGGVLRDEIRGNVVFLADPRNNNLLVLSSPENFPAIRDLVGRLDTASADARPELTRVFQLRYGDEGEVSRQLQEMLGLGRPPAGGGTASETVAVESTRLVPIKRTRSIMVSTRSPEVLARVAELLTYLDRRLPVESSNVRVYRVRHADAKALAEILGHLAQTRNKGKAGAAAGDKPEEITFTADPHTNSILITGSPQLFAQYEPILAGLDVMRQQILVEVLIAEVSGNLTRNMGIEWGVIDPNKDGYRGFGGTNFGLKAQATGGSGFQIGLVKGGLDLDKLSDGNLGELSKIKALVRLYQNNANFNILSAPQLLTTDNEEAKITVGEVVALPQGFTKDRDSGRFDLTNFKYEDVGINLVITPRVNGNEMVTLKINQEVKKRQEENLYEFNVPVLTKRQMETTITIPDHETIVIGGLMREDKTVVEDRVPLLSNIPVLGHAFRNKRKTIQKTNLMVFMTPHILSTPEAVARFDAAEFRKSPAAPVSNQRLERPAVEARMDRMREKALDAFRRFKGEGKDAAPTAPGAAPAGDPDAGDAPPDGSSVPAPGSAPVGGPDAHAGPASTGRAVGDDDPTPARERIRSGGRPGGTTPRPGATRLPVPVSPARAATSNRPTPPSPAPAGE